MNSMSIDTDILVVGGGSAGAAAAIAAARSGAAATLIEAGNCLGGTSTAGGVCSWFASTDGLGSVFDDFRRGLDEAGALCGRAFNAEVAKFVWQRLAEEAGVRVIYHAMPVTVNVVGRRVDQVDVVCRASRFPVSARFVVDATGEGDLCALAGAEFEKGDPERGHTLHMSLTATMFDTGSPVTPYLPPGLSPIESDEDLPGLSGPGKLPDGRLYLNMTKVMEHDPTDPLSLSDAELEARTQLMRVVHYIQRTRYPSYALASSGSRIGIREGRRVVGDYTIAEQDVLGDGTVFDDGVAVATCQIDFHSLTRPGQVGWRKRVKPYNIPLPLTRREGLREPVGGGQVYQRRSGGAEQLPDDADVRLHGPGSRHGGVDGRDRRLCGHPGRVRGGTACCPGRSRR